MSSLISLRKINKIIIHCSDSPDTQDIGAKEIREWHTKGNGWSDIGYHFVIRRNGHIELGRPLYIAGAHVKGYNSDSIGICWVGRDNITSEQMDALIKTVRNLMFSFNVDVKNVFGHYELDSGKTCPRLDMNAIRKTL